MLMIASRCRKRGMPAWRPSGLSARRDAHGLNESCDLLPNRHTLSDSSGRIPREGTCRARQSSGVIIGTYGQAIGCGASSAHGTRTARRSPLVDQSPLDILPVHDIHLHAVRFLPETDG